jgi:hypothetical protein
MKVKAIRKLVFWLLLNTLGSLEVWVFWAVGEKVGLGKSQRVGIFHKFSLLFFLCVLARIQRRQFHYDTCLALLVRVSLSNTVHKPYGYETTCSRSRLTTYAVDS